MRKHLLHKVFEPQSVAIVGASERPQSVGTQLLDNLIDSGFQGDIYPVNPGYQSLRGLRCYPAISAVDHAIDLVVIVIPAKAIPGVLHECGEAGVGAVIIVSAGFAEVGSRGRSLQDEIVDIARTYRIPLVGPNCLGIVRPSVGLNASFAKNRVAPGHVALVAQSGAFCTAMMDGGESNGFGFSAVASLGATADVGFGEVLDYLALDGRTKSILLYIEGVADARSFISGLRVAARMKPVIVIKSGRSECGNRAAVSHTGATVGRDEVFDAAIRRAGAVRVATTSQLISAAQTLASGIRVGGSRLAILTNGGGPGVMAADRAADLQVPLAQLSPPTIEKLSAVLPEHWSHAVPVDILGDASSERYRAATEILLADENVDGLLVLLTPQAMTDPTACAESVIAASRDSRKPVMACWLGQKLVKEGRERFAAAGIPWFMTPEAGVNGFGYLAAYHRNQDILLQAPPPLSRTKLPDVAGARLIIEQAMNERRSILGNIESKALLRAFQIPISPSMHATTAGEALIMAESIGLPVAMKINSPDIHHKTEVGGVRLHIREPHSVRDTFREMLDEVKAHRPDAHIEGVTIEAMVERPRAREMMITITRDEIFGPIISFGTGGTAADVCADRQIALPPLNDFLARELIGSTRAQKMLGPFRSLPPADIDSLVEVLKRVSEMACELPELCELEINPLLVDENGIIAVDAHILVAPPARDHGHYSHMAIHPYPPGLETTWHLGDGTDVVVRPIRPEDAEFERHFVDSLSDQSKYFRFMNHMNKISPLMLARFTQIDYDREMALVAVINEHTPEAGIIGVARYISNPDDQSCEFALTVSDDWQRRGIGRQLMQRLMSVARSRGLEIMEGDVLAQNTKMLRLCTALGFRTEHDSQDPEVVVVRQHL
ncbi:MAG: bifunctional acetate--CoA ligase family protein/GNAT family N-acetyltransferase [Pseudomonadales bacterium]|nr:bifunctional acetate--CoA ligase family protein/GNAT family N-acetyltransferase [Pseudomonadales bacterium]